MTIKPYFMFGKHLGHQYNKYISILLLRIILVSEEVEAIFLPDEYFNYFIWLDNYIKWNHSKYRSMGVPLLHWILLYGQSVE